jgi:hypothetical protein
LDKPTFIGVGGQKCASTWISEILRYHPEIYMSENKEINYFSINYDKELEWYLSNFKGASKEKAIGEFSTVYLYNLEIPVRIKKDIGNVKIIISIRNPVDRFFSHYMHSYRANRLLFSDPLNLNFYNFNNAIKTGPNLLGHGLYSKGILEYTRVFGAENVLVVIKEDIDNNPEEVVRKIYNFLGVDKNFQPTIINKKVSKGIIPKNLTLEIFRRILYKFFSKKNPKVINIVKKTRLSELYRKVNAKKEAINISPKVKKYLRDYYVEEIIHLEKILKRDLSNWKS